MRADCLRNLLLLLTLGLAGVSLGAACDGGTAADTTLAPSGAAAGGPDLAWGAGAADAAPPADGGAADLVAADGAAAPDAGSARCHPRIAEAIDTCLSDWLADPDVDPSVASRVDLLERCADAEPVAPARDALCAEDDAPDALCDVDYETFATTQLPVCFREAYERLSDAACVFGERWRDLFGPAEAIVIVDARVLTAASPLTPLEAAQIVRAVTATAYDDVVSAGGVFAAVDRHEVNRLELWDASGRRPYTAYEVGAGDNSFGMVFRYGTTTPVALVRDGDFVDCLVTWGPERRRCLDDGDCAPRLRCTGRPAERLLGRCIAVDADEHPARGQACRQSAECPHGAGLVCAGASDVGYGACQPAWMRGRYEVRPALAVPDASLAGAEAPLLVWGLAEEAADVTLDLAVSHPRAPDLLVTLTTPTGREVVVVDGDADGAELALWDWPVLALPPGEPANGIWRLRVTDLRAGAAGSLARFGLGVTSRPAAVR